MSVEVMAKTAAEALKVATGPKGSVMVLVAPKSYEIRTWDIVREAWIASSTMDYHRARAYLTEARHAEALEAMGWSKYDAQCEAMDSNAFGPLRDRVKRSAAKVGAA